MGKRLEEPSLVTREYFLHFSVEGGQGRSLEGIQTSSVRLKFRNILYDMTYHSIAQDIKYLLPQMRI